MLDTLRRICDGGGRIGGVAYTLFGGDPRFVTAVGLQFESLAAVFRAGPGDNTLVAFTGPLVPAAEESLTQVGHLPPWSACVGRGVRGAWSWTNQRWYTDGVRLEFGDPGKASRAVVELLVIASAIKVFVATEAGL